MRRRSEFKGYSDLEDLAMDLIWSWNHSGDILWEKLDTTLWHDTHNPWVVLQTVSKDQLEKNLADPSFCKLLKEMKEKKKQKEKDATWFKQACKDKCPVTSIAYFSMEFMLSEALPIYSGGLGNVAGDQLKSASDLGIPVIGIGLLYQQGYFRQMITKDGAQQAFYPFNDPGQLPITPLRTKNGEWLRIELALPGWSVWLRAWEVKVGRVKLYLLDTNDPANFPAHRGITSELYGGDKELRLKQELVLGIGGARLLQALGIQTEVFHLNEGHAAFSILERAHLYMKENGVDFETALQITRAGNHFTTHTAVQAGFDQFEPFLIDLYLTDYTKDKLGISMQQLMALGRANPSDPHEPFNMAFLAMRGCGSVNAVSQLHAKVSQNIFTPLFPRWPKEEIPIGYITNGIHVPSWDSKEFDQLWTTACGKNRWMWETESLEKEIKSLSTVQIWEARNSCRNNLIEYIKEIIVLIGKVRGYPPEEVKRVQNVLNPHAFTMGFARRFATYKRTNILLHDRERLLRILSNPKYPAQLVFAGKAHPRDYPGQAMIQEWIQFIRRPDVRGHIVFLPDYDMHVTEHIVQGVDLWINTPRRPWEACGTSGMKVLANGVLNVSELDGWWAEAYNPKVGWAIGDGKEHGDDPAWDAKDANQLYDLLEHEIIPQFYARDAQGIPVDWMNKVKESIASLTPRFSSNRAVREYVEKYYIPAAAKYEKRAARKGELGKKQVAWLHDEDSLFNKLRFGEIRHDTQGNMHNFQIQLYLGDVDPNKIQLQLFAEGVKQELKRTQELPGKMFLYQGSVPSSVPAEFYTPRVLPFNPDLSLPLEANYLLWQR